MTDNGYNKQDHPRYHTVQGWAVISLALAIISIINIEVLYLLPYSEQTLPFTSPAYTFVISTPEFFILGAFITGIISIYKASKAHASSGAKWFAWMGIVLGIASLIWYVYPAMG